MARTPAHDEALGCLSQALWRERQLLEILLFRLVEEQALLDSGQERWLPRAIDEVDDAVEQLQVAELGREVELAAVTAELALDGATGAPGPAPTLRAVIDSVDQPWSEIMAGHREAFVELTGRIRHAAARNRDGVARVLEEAAGGERRPPGSRG